MEISDTTDHGRTARIDIRMPSTSNASGWSFLDEAGIHKDSRISIWVTIEGSNMVLLADAHIVDMVKSPTSGRSNSIITIVAEDRARDDPGPDEEKHEIQGILKVEMGPETNVRTFEPTSQKDGNDAASGTRSGHPRSTIIVEGELDTVAYGGVLRAKHPVEVMGAGRHFSGMYYVDEVTHCFEAQDYRQHFVLKRNETS